MKKISIIILISVLILINLVQFLNYNFSLYFADDKLPNFTDDVIPNEQIALEVAEAILKSVYGERILEEKPFYIRYNNIKRAWVISGRDNSDENTVSGVASIIIRKKDGRVLKLTHGM